MPRDWRHQLVARDMVGMPPAPGEAAGRLSAKRSSEIEACKHCTLCEAHSPPCEAAVRVPCGDAAIANRHQLHPVSSKAPPREDTQHTIVQTMHAHITHQTPPCTHQGHAPGARSKEGRHSPAVEKKSMMAASRPALPMASITAASSGCTSAVATSSTALARRHTSPVHCPGCSTSCCSPYRVAAGRVGSVSRPWCQDRDAAVRQQQGGMQGISWQPALRGCCR
jgi:hypothetical protein